MLGGVNYIRNARFPYLFFKEQQSPGPSCQSSKQLFLLAGAVLQGGAQRVPFSSPVGCPPSLITVALLQVLAFASLLCNLCGERQPGPFLSCPMASVRDNEERRERSLKNKVERASAVDRSVGFRAVGGWRAVSLFGSLQTRPNYSPNIVKQCGSSLIYFFF